MRASGWGLAALLIAAPAMAGDQALSVDPPVRASARPARLPFELKDNLVRLDVVVNGTRLSGVLDSGAAAIVVDRAAGRRLGLAEGAAAGNVAGGGTEAKQLLPITVATLKAGPFTFRNAAGYAVDLAHLTSSAGFPVDVIVGAPAFRQGAVTVDYPRRLVIFHPPGVMPGCAAPIPLRILHDVPAVEVELVPGEGAAPVRLNLVVDLGTRHAAVTVGGPFVRSEAGQVLMKRGVARQVGQGIGGRVRGVVAPAAGLRAGPVDLGALEATLTSEVPAFEAGVFDGSLGVPLWSHGAITFDYAAGRLCIDPPRRGGGDDGRGEHATSPKADR